MPRETFNYTSEELTVIWKPNQCIHSKICWQDLKEVFDPTRKPWIQLENSTAEKIIEQVRKCPSGALSYKTTNMQTEIQSETSKVVNIEIKPNGPILIKTECVILHSDGTEEVRTGSTALCRCGASNKKPYCDGEHKKIEFKG